VREAIYTVCEGERERLYIQYGKGGERGYIQYSVGKREREAIYLV
jgi:hypothetical protein